MLYNTVCPLARLHESLSPAQLSYLKTFSSSIFIIIPHYFIFCAYFIFFALYFIPCSIFNSYITFLNSLATWFNIFIFSLISPLYTPWSFFINNSICDNAGLVIYQPSKIFMGRNLSIKRSFSSTSASNPSNSDPFNGLITPVSKYTGLDTTSNLSALASIEKNNSGIYAIVNRVNGKIYIGSTVSLGKRIPRHFVGTPNLVIQHSIRKYGPKAFDVYI
jgi:hypothetical protein